jgi:hypothetical protein
MKKRNRKVSDEKIFQKLFSQQDEEWTACLMKYDALDKYSLNELEQKTKQSIITEIIEEIEKVFIYTPKSLSASASGSSSYDRLTLPRYSSSSSSFTQSSMSNHHHPPPPPPSSSSTSAPSSSCGNKNSSLITHRVRFNDENKTNYSQDNNNFQQSANRHNSEVTDIKTFLPTDPHQKRLALSEHYQTILNSKNLSVDNMKHNLIKSVEIKSVSSREKNAAAFNNLRFSSESLPLQQSEPVENEPPSSSSPSPSLSSASFRRMVFPSSTSSAHSPAATSNSAHHQQRRAETASSPEKQFTTNISNKEASISEIHLFQRNQKPSAAMKADNVELRSESHHHSTPSLLKEEKGLSVSLGDEFYSYTSLMDDIVNDFIEETKQHSSQISSFSSSVLTANNPLYEDIEKDYNHIFSTFDNLISNHKNKLHLLSFDIDEGITTEEREEQPGDEVERKSRKPFSSSLTSSGDLNKTVQKYIKKLRKLLENERKLSEYNKELTSEIHHQFSSLGEIVEKSQDFIVKCSNLVSSSLSSYDYALKWKIHVDSINNIEMVS